MRLKIYSPNPLRDGIVSKVYIVAKGSQIRDRDLGKNMALATVATG